MRSAQCLLLTLATLALAGPAGAATINVTTETDEYGGGPGTGCSVREAIRAANMNARFGGCPKGAGPSDTIRIPAGTYPIQIAPTSSDIPNPDEEGDLNVTTRMSIIGTGRSATKLDGADLDRLFYVNAGTNRVTFSNLTIQHGQPGNPAMRYGAGIHTLSPVTIANVLFLDNHGSLGGGLYSNAPVVIRDSRFSRNVADLSSGGGAYISNAATITRTMFSRNDAEQGGGGLYGSQKTTSADKVTVSDNEAYEGGGIAVSDGKLVLTNSVVEANEAVGPATGQQGGGIDTLSSNVTVRNSTIRGNTAENSGGGLYTEGGRIQLHGVTVAGNESDAFGGGLYALFFDLADQNSVTITRSTFRDNSTGVSGGGLFLGGETDGTPDYPVSIERSLVARNHSGGYTPVDPQGFTGMSDGIHNQALLTMTNSTITRNSDPLHEGRGGGLVNAQFATAELRNVTITNNRARPVEGDGDNVFNQGVMSVKSSIVGGASETGSCATAAPAVPATSQGHNLEFETGGNRCFDKPSDRIGNPRLGPLAANGGPTQTLALRPGSAALGHGQGCTSSDQRGVPRSLGGPCDAGAYELVRCEGVIVNRVGTSGADVLKGTKRADGMLGLGGPDRLKGGDGGDGLCGGDGADRLIGGAGNDACSGGPGTDGATACERRASIP
jgi:CSLREA domain-containing protein